VALVSVALSAALAGPDALPAWSTTASVVSAPSAGPAVLSSVAGSGEGSSDPTYYALNHRVAKTVGGRLLVVLGWHKTGVRLKWSDDGGVTWSAVTRGAHSDGGIDKNMTSGDRPASIAVVDGAAYVVWGSPSYNGVTAMRRLSDLDNAAGPVVGPAVQLSTGSSARRADVAVETAPDGTQRVCFTWWEDTPSGTYNNHYAWVSDLTTDTPTLTKGVLDAVTGSGYYGTLIERPGGLGYMGRRAGGSTYLKTRSNTDPPDVWKAAAVNTRVSSKAAWGAAGAFAGDRWHAAYLSNVTSGAEQTRVSSWSADGNSLTHDLTLNGYLEPALTTDGTTVMLIARRVSDNAVVSRTWTAPGGWSATDNVEVSGLANARNPNTARSLDNGKLLMLLRSDGTSSSQSNVHFASRQALER
jgi:hypothetical protein